ncbi:MAG: dihydropteroate synthase [Planctomycetes bacterium]|nr:dihydropteroate synthase [Planctomycetota bacterium]
MSALSWRDRAARVFEFSLPGGRRWRVGPLPAIMGVLNVTPDSFSDGGLYPDASSAVEAGLRMLREGADLLDIGGESTRPGSRGVSAEEQLRRVLPVLSGLRDAAEAPISVDTRDPRVAEAALRAGADIINDVSAFQAPGWEGVLGEPSVPLVLMHMRGTPADMQLRTEYPRGVVLELCEELGRSMESLCAQGVSRDRLILDPGIGFAKEWRHNLQILDGLGKLLELGRPVLVGVSRKSFLGPVLCPGGGAIVREPVERDVATVAANAFAALQGASILRVHNVAYTRDLVDVLGALYHCGSAEAEESGGR